MRCETIISFATRNHRGQNQSMCLSARPRGSTSAVLNPLAKARTTFPVDSRKQ